MVMTVVVIIKQIEEFIQERLSDKLVQREDTIQIVGVQLMNILKQHVVIKNS